MRNPTTTLLTTLATTLAAALLAGCGGSDHGDADVAFAQGMIPHHAQAVEMADLALESSEDAEVRALAEEVRDAQAPEIETMTGWLEEWDEDVPSAGHGDMAGMEEMPGMMTGDDMDALAAATGEELDRLWLAMMVEHHEGAIEMAETEQADGTYDPAVDLAGEIVETQQAEIDRMQQLLG